MCVCVWVRACLRFFVHIYVYAYTRVLPQISRKHSLSDKPVVTQESVLKSHFMRPTGDLLLPASSSGVLLPRGIYCFSFFVDFAIAIGEKQSVSVKFCYLLGKRANKIVLTIQPAYKFVSTSKIEVNVYFSGFRNVHLSLEDQSLSGWPATSLKNENIMEIHEPILEYRHRMINENVDITDKSLSCTCQGILSKELWMKKVAPIFFASLAQGRTKSVRAKYASWNWITFGNWSRILILLTSLLVIKSGRVKQKTPVCLKDIISRKLQYYFEHWKKNLDRCVASLWTREYVNM